MYEVAYGYADKKSIASDLEELKKEKFWYDAINMTTKLKLFMVANFSKFARFLHKINNSPRQS